MPWNKCLVTTDQLLFVNFVNVKTSDVLMSLLLKGKDTELKTGKKTNIKWNSLFLLN